MPELRRDPLSRRWVVIASERARRPHDFARQPRAASHGAIACPFCPGHESETPPEVMAFRLPGTLPDTPGWSVRVVPNLYPAFGPAVGDLGLRDDGLFSAMLGLGAHEVIIVSPQHEETVALLPREQLLAMARAFAVRYRHHSENQLIAYVHIILNYGREAGASREHPHAQLFALPIVPGLMEAELAASEDYYAAQGRCLLCELGQHELAGGERVIWQDERFLLFAPFASRAPFEMWLLPKAHRPRFEEADEAELASFAAGLHEALGRLHGVVGDPPFNFWLHTSPTRREVDPFYHWHLEIQPKLSIAAGFELGTDIMINSMPPELAASYLRQGLAPPPGS